jgi:hypothetical protein
MGASAGINAGAPPDDTTGELKIIKNLGGQWPDGAFIFTWDCTDGQSGSATFPDDFTGANFETNEEYPLGTICTVEETDGVLSVSDYNVSTHIESSAGFQAINPRDVPINNSTGQNVIQYKNDPKPTDPETGSLKIIKQPTPGNADGPWKFTWVCDDKAGTSGTAVYPDDFAPGKEYDVPGDIVLGTDCTVTETFPNLDAASWDTSYQIEGGPFTAGTVAIVPIKNTGTNTVKFKNDFIEPEPEIATITVVKKFEGPDDWRFGFAFTCEGELFDSVVLGGGESASSGVAFYGEPQGMRCAVAEQLLVGGWTVNVKVTGTDKFDTTPTGFAGAAAAFAIYPGDAITVTFENIPGYGAQAPSGIPPVIPDP